MKMRKLKIFCSVLIAATGYYVYKNWENYNDKMSFNIDSFELSQKAFDISSVKSKFQEPVWFIKNETPLIVFSICFKNEGNRSFSNQPGILNLIDNSIIEGAGTRDAQEFKKILNEKQISLSFVETDDNVTINCSCLERHLDIAVELLCDMLSKAHFKEENIQAAKDKLIFSLRQNKFLSNAVAKDSLNNILFPKEHPYHATIDETIAYLNLCSREELLDCYQKIFDQKDAEIVISGNLDQNKIVEIFDKIHNCILHKKNDFKDVEQKSDIPEVQSVVKINLDTPQSSVLFALPGCLTNEKDVYAARFALSIFGNTNFSARLFKNIRETNGFVYRIKATLAESRMQSCVIGECGTRPENVDEVISKIKAEVSEFYEGGITEKEFKDFKVSYFSSNLLNSSWDVVSFILNLRKEHFKINEINSYLNNYYNLRFEDVNRVIKKIFDAKKLIFVSCGQDLSANIETKISEAEKND